MSEWNLGGASIAENYERYLVPAIFAPIAADLLDIVSPQLGDSVLDVACGTGVVARRATQLVGPSGQVVGVDMLADMLDQAQALPATDPPVEWRQAAADDLPFPDDSFNVVLCQHGLQFFPDKAAALREMVRVLAPNGKLGLLVLEDISRMQPLTALKEALASNIGPEPASFVQVVGSMGDEAELRHLVEEAGFREVRVRGLTKDVEFPSPEEFLRQYLVSTPLAASPSVSQADESVRRKVESDLRSRLEPHQAGEGWAFPASNYLATARK